MKNPSTLLLLLLLAAAPAGAADMAVHSADIATSMDEGEDETGGGEETITFNGAKHPKYVDPNQYGPLLPGQEWKDASASAFNALQSMPPMERIAVTAPDGKTYAHDVEFKRDAKGKIVGGTIAFDTGNACLAPVPISGLAGKQPLQPWEKAFLDHVAKNAGDYAMPDLLKAAGVNKDKTDAENKGFCPSGDCGSAPKGGGFSALADNGGADETSSDDAPSSNGYEAADIGNQMGQDMFASLSGTGGDSGMGGSSASSGFPGDRSPVVYKGEVTAFSGTKHGWKELDKAEVTVDRLRGRVGQPFDAGLGPDTGAPDVPQNFKATVNQP